MSHPELKELSKSQKSFTLALECFLPFIYYGSTVVFSDAKESRCGTMPHQA
jgi:hypothetical protein